MLKILERTSIQTASEVETEFPNSRYIMIITDEENLSGYLQAVSTSAESYMDLADYCGTMEDSGTFYIGGEYAEGDSCSVQFISSK